MHAIWSIINNTFSHCGKNLYNYKSKADFTEAGELTSSNTNLSLSIHYPLNRYEIKNDSYEMKFDLKGVNQFEASGDKIYCKKLNISFYELQSLEFIRKFILNN